MVISQITTLRAHLLWQLMCGRPSVGRSTPTRMAISQIPTLRPHLLWQVICGWAIVGRSIPHRTDYFTDYCSESSPTLTAHMQQTKSVGRSIPHRMVIHRLLPLRAQLLWQLLCGRASVGRSTLTRMAWFHRLLLWELTYSDRSYVAEQV